VEMGLDGAHPITDHLVPAPPIKPYGSICDRCDSACHRPSHPPRWDIQVGRFRITLDRAGPRDRCRRIENARIERGIRRFASYLLEWSGREESNRP
jgi:hypothetical protein